MGNESAPEYQYGRAVLSSEDESSFPRDGLGKGCLYMSACLFVLARLAITAIHNQYDSDKNVVCQ